MFVVSVVLVDVSDLGVAPKPFKIIVFAKLPLKHMCHNVNVIDQDPFAILLSFGMKSSFSQSRQPHR